MAKGEVSTYNEGAVTWSGQRVLRLSALEVAASPRAAHGQGDGDRHDGECSPADPDNAETCH